MNKTFWLAAAVLAAWTGAAVLPALAQPPGVSSRTPENGMGMSMGHMGNGMMGGSMMGRMMNGRMAGGGSGMMQSMNGGGQPNSQWRAPSRSHGMPD